MLYSCCLLYSCNINNDSPPLGRQPSFPRLYAMVSQGDIPIRLTNK